MLKVETAGEFMLVDPITGAEIAHEGVSEVPDSQFVRDRIELGQLRVVEDEKPAKPAAAKAK
jgi:hypothetical protein